MSSYDKWIWVILVVIASVATIIFVREAILHHDTMWTFLFLSLLTEMFLIFCYYNLFQLGKTGVLFGIAKGMAVVVVAILSIFLFNEKLGWKSWVGLALIIIGIVLI